MGHSCGLVHSFTDFFGVFLIFERLQTMLWQTGLLVFRRGFCKILHMSDLFFPPPSFDQRDVVIHHRERVYDGFCGIDRVSLQHRQFADAAYAPVLQRELVVRRPAVGVILHDPKHRLFALIEQFRVGALADPISPWQLEIVAGLIDAGESAETAAIREAYEETGVQVEHLTRLFHFYPSAGACDEVFTLYAGAADLSQAHGLHGAADEGEDIRLHTFDCDQLNHFLGSGRLVNAPVIIALQWLHTQYGSPLEG
jgi:ADP-ribose pyrophosphatase